MEERLTGSACLKEEEEKKIQLINNEVRGKMK